MIFTSAFILIIGLYYLYYWSKNIKNKPKEDLSFTDGPYLAGGIMFTVIGFIFLLAEIIKLLK